MELYESLEVSLLCLQSHAMDVVSLMLTSVSLPPLTPDPCQPFPHRVACDIPYYYSAHADPATINRLRPPINSILLVLLVLHPTESFNDPFTATAS